MTREEALNILHNASVYHPDYLDALNIAIQSLEQEPCEDCISRQAAKKALEDRFIELQKRHSVNKYETNFCLNTILELPSVTPKPKTGTDEMWQEFESQLLREIHTPMTMDYDSSIRMAEMGVKEVLNKWKYRLSEPKTDVLDKIRAEIEKLKPNNPYFKGYFEQNVALNKALEVIDKYTAEARRSK